MKLLKTLCLRIHLRNAFDRRLYLLHVKTFVISEAITTVSASNATSTSEQNTTTASSSTTATTATNVSTTDNSYTDDNIQINLETITTNNTTVYVADIQVSSPEYLKQHLHKTLTVQT